MCTLFDDHSSIEDNDLIGMRNGGQSVPSNPISIMYRRHIKSNLRNNEQCSALADVPHIVLNFLFRVGIKG